MEWVQNNWGTLLIILSAGINLASAIAALTRTDKDDKILAVIKDFLSKFISLK